MYIFYSKKKANISKSLKKSLLQKTKKIFSNHKTGELVACLSFNPDKKKRTSSKTMFCPYKFALYLEHFSNPKLELICGYQLIC